jgi:hypothetical protein
MKMEMTPVETIPGIGWEGGKEEWWMGVFKYIL